MVAGQGTAALVSVTGHTLYPLPDYLLTHGSISTSLLQVPSIWQNTTLSFSPSLEYPQSFLGQKYRTADAYGLGRTPVGSVQLYIPMSLSRTGKGGVVQLIAET